MRQAFSPWLEKHRQWALRHPLIVSDSYAQVLQEVAHSPAKYKGKPVEFLYQPFFLTPEQWGELEVITRRMMDLIHKVTQAYVQVPELRRRFGFPPLMEQLILKEPGYAEAVPVTRIDLFYHLETGDFQFCEINTDGSSGMVEARELQQIIGNSAAVEKLGIPHGNLRQGEFFDSWVAAFLSNYQQWCLSQNRQPSSTPRIAIVDLLTQDPPTEFSEFQKSFLRAGCACLIVDARDLKIKGGHLMAGEIVIDAVYRRLVTWELVENQKELKPLIQAILDDIACVVGPVRSQIPHNKQFFAILHDENTAHFLSQEERNFVKRHVPFTARLEEGDSLRWLDWLENKDRLIIKPTDRYASYGVYAGRDHEIIEWEQKLRTAAAQSYLIQEYCQVPRMPMAVVTKDGATFESFYYLIGCFVYNGIFQGPYIRAGRHSIIGSVVECFTVPAFCVSE
ncbi:MAG: glutathionylspermidine synthase family protein [Bacillota bacterium]|nr:glutathionylspermidine synthase family protein [Bacillota bacterium]MDW7676632.1 glutathionylspermidine synthase family protein [Bacillota bacterium]